MDKIADRNMGLHTYMVDKINELVEGYNEMEAKLKAMSYYNELDRRLKRLEKIEVKRILDNQ